MSERVYFAWEWEPRLIKVGTSGQVETRLRALSSERGTTFSLIVDVPGSYDEERCVHHRFSHLRAERCEWFRPEPDLFDFIRETIALGKLPFTVEESVQRMAEMQANGASLREIAEAFGGGTSWVDYMLRKHGLLRTKEEAIAARRPQAVAMYQSGMSLRSVADRLGVEKETVRQDLRACGVQTRTRWARAA